MDSRGRRQRLTPDFAAWAWPGEDSLVQARLPLTVEAFEVAAEQPRGELTDAAKQRIQQRRSAAYPGYRYGVFLELGLPSEWALSAYEAREFGVQDRETSSSASTPTSAWTCTWTPTRPTPRG